MTKSQEANLAYAKKQLAERLRLAEIRIEALELSVEKLRSFIIKRREALRRGAY